MRFKTFFPVHSFRHNGTNNTIQTWTSLYIFILIARVLWKVWRYQRRNQKHYIKSKDKLYKWIGDETAKHGPENITEKKQKIKQLHKHIQWLIGKKDGENNCLSNTTKTQYQKLGDTSCAPDG